MKNEIVFATGNLDKMREIREILSGMDFEIRSMKEAQIVTNVEETGETFEENARLKAEAVAKKTDAIVIADDSGLEIDYLNGEPGVYSARYMGEDTSYQVKNQALLDRLKGVPKEQRSARFVCAVAVAFPDGEMIVRRETMEGYIGEAPAGENGFGYDGCSSAELSSRQKNEISHRGKALMAIRKEIEKRI